MPAFAQAFVVGAAHWLPFTTPSHSHSNSPSPSAARTAPCPPWRPVLPQRCLYPTRRRGRPLVVACTATPAPDDDSFPSPAPQQPQQPQQPGDETFAGMVSIDVFSTGDDDDDDDDDGFNQWDQHEKLDKSSMLREKNTVRQLAQTHCQRHFHVFLQKSTIGIFTNACDNFLNSLRVSSPSSSAQGGAGATADAGVKSKAETDTAIERGTDTGTLWVLKAVADVTFGSLSGMPSPPRMVVVTRLAPGGATAAGRSVNVGTSAATTSVDTAERVMSWVAALDRSGTAFHSMESHHVDWTVLSTHVSASPGTDHGSDSTNTATETATGPGPGPAAATGESSLRRVEATVNMMIQPGVVVAAEIINANWARRNAISGMRGVLQRHAQKAVDLQLALAFIVLQSVDEPTCFKTVEVYRDVDCVKACLGRLGEAFQQDSSVHRAAVYRVRQLHECIACL